MSEINAPPTSEAIATLARETADELSDIPRCYRPRLVAVIASALASVAQERETEIARLQQALEDDAADLWRVTNAIRDELRSRWWITESRGSYEYDDERYRREARHAFEAIEKWIHQVQHPTQRRFHDLMRDVPSRPEVERLRAELAQVKAQRDVFDEQASGLFMKAFAEGERARKAEVELAQALDAVEGLLCGFVWPRPEGEPEHVTSVTRECHKNGAEWLLRRLRDLPPVSERSEGQ